MNKAYILAGLGYGDEGKGSIVDFLTSILRPESVIRYNGGPQAAHHVFHNGITHCFSQFSSGSFNNKTQTFLSKYMLVDPLALELEEEALQQKGFGDVMKYHSIDPHSIIITPFSKIVGQMRELSNNYGSCGRGVGEALNDSKNLGEISIYAKDLKDERTLEQKMKLLWIHKIDQAQQIVEQNPNQPNISYKYIQLSDRKIFEETVRLYNKISQKINIKEYESQPIQIFEGAQGALLDVEYGFWPHVTKTDITFNNAYRLISPGTEINKIGVMRAYSTRHGRGPFVTEDIHLTKALPELHNKFNEWQGPMRIGWPDMVATRYALNILRDVESIAVTSLDRLPQDIKICVGYRYDFTNKNKNRHSKNFYPGSEYIEHLFENEKTSKGFIINNIKKRDNMSAEMRTKLTDIISHCKPIYKDLKCGRKKSLHDHSSIHQEYISFLESEDGLATPIGITSYGPQRNAKHLSEGIDEKINDEVDLSQMWMT